MYHIQVAFWKLNIVLAVKVPFNEKIKFSSYPCVKKKSTTNIILAWLFFSCVAVLSAVGSTYMQAHT